jgi:hypothetical protein
MSEKKFLSVPESCLLTGKSESTIKRFLQKNFKNDRSKDSSKTSQNIKKEKAQNGFYWFVEENFLLKNFPITAETKNSEESEMINFLKEQLENKDQQMKEKDGQISQLLERQRESNILLKNSQEKNLLLEAKTEEIEKKGFWKNIFG